MLHFGAHMINIGKIATDSLFYSQPFLLHLNLVDCKDGMNHQSRSVPVQGAACILGLLCIVAS